MHSSVWTQGDEPSRTRCVPRGRRSPRAGTRRVDRSGSGRCTTKRRARRCSWTRRVAWSTIRDRVSPLASAQFAIAHAEAGFTANVPASALELEGALLVTHADGEPLAPEHGWPLRLVVPGRYFWKSAKWLRAIELRAADAPGFWERYGYHNDADPWREERYGF